MLCDMNVATQKTLGEYSDSSPAVTCGGAPPGLAELRSFERWFLMRGRGSSAPACGSNNCRGGVKGIFPALPRNAMPTRAKRCYTKVSLFARVTAVPAPAGAGMGLRLPLSRPGSPYPIPSLSRPGFQNFSPATRGVSPMADCPDKPDNQKLLNGPALSLHFLKVNHQI